MKESYEYIIHDGKMYIHDEKGNVIIEGGCLTVRQ